MRKPAVSGQFYPGNSNDLRKQLDRCFHDVKKEKRRVIGGVVPHAGYIYSGNVAAHVFSKVAGAKTFVIIGLNHRSMGSAVSVSAQPWETPLGTVEVDYDFIKALPKRIIDTDEVSHKYEHSIEVQLPFLQYKFNKFKIVPISMALQDEETAKEVGDEISETIKKLRSKAVILASSDFTHYEPDSVARKVDGYVIEPILGLNVSEFYQRLRNKNASVCGFGPIAAMMHAVKNLGAKEGELIKYATSGEVAKDMTSVVGYAGIVMI